MTDTPSPAVAVTASIGEDPELLALGKQLDQIEQRWIERRVMDIKESVLDSTDPEGEIWSSIHDQLYPLTEHILRRKARTLTGLAIQARATSMVFSEYWLLPPDLDESGNPSVNDYIRLFIEGACSLAGMVPVPVAAQRVANPKS
jgi:hypothetical protein